MPYQVEHLIEEHSAPMTAGRDEPVIAALNRMIEHDYSQLPVVDSNNSPVGMITHEGILRGLRNFHAQLEDLCVRDVMTKPELLHHEDDLFLLLEKLKLNNAVLIVDPDERLTGIVTGYDATEYFRNRAENLMRLEEIESMLKEFIIAAYTAEDGSLKSSDLSEAITRVAGAEKGGKPVAFDELSLGQYILILLSKRTWSTFEMIFRISHARLRGMLEDVRNTRNELAHFRSEITVQQSDQLRFCAEWLTQRRDEYEQTMFQRQPAETVAVFRSQTSSTKPLRDEGQITKQHEIPIEKASIDPVTARSDEIPPIAEVSLPKESRYGPLADWLMSQPGRIDQVKLKFPEIEEIIQGNLPDSAYKHRAWWSNNAQGHPHSLTWLDAGWRTTYVNLSEKHVTFSRIREREKAYIEFFSQVLAELRQRKDFPYRDVSPDGSNWMVCQTTQTPGAVVGYYNLSFARGKRFRVELYLDTYDQSSTKQVFDEIYQQKAALESALGEISWERIDDKRASRLALYHPGDITGSPEELEKLRRWAVERLAAFYNAVEPVARRAIRKVLKA